MNKLYPFLLLLMVLCAGCREMQVLSKNKMMSVQKGMSKQEVVKLLGDPDYRRFESDYEEWEYKYFSYADGTDFLTIRFIENTVEGLNSFFMPNHSIAPHNATKEKEAHP